MYAETKTKLCQSNHQPNPKTYIVVVGADGKNPVEKKYLNLKHYEFMTRMIISYINKLGIDPYDIILVSGGSAWAQHIVIELYLNNSFGGLNLYLPSTFDTKQKKFVNTHEGRLLNGLHAEFKNKIPYIDSLNDLTNIINSGFKSGIRVEVKRGFKQRNTLMTHECDHLLAFVFDVDSDSINTDVENIWTKVKCINKIKYDLSPVT